MSSIHYDKEPWKLGKAICGEPSQHGRMTTASKQMVTCPACLKALEMAGLTV